MIKPALINKIKLFSGLLFLFLFSYFLEVNLAIPLLLVAVCLYLRLSCRNYRLLYLALLFVLIFTLSYFIIREGLPTYYIPFCSLPMLAILLFNDMGISLMLTLVSSLSIAYLAHDNYLGLLFLTSGIISLILVRASRRRGVIIRTGLIIGLLQMLALFFIDRFKVGYPLGYLMFMLNGVASAIIVIGTLPIFEYLFGVVTNISLLELADFNQPLLQRLTIEAPGTYHHSLIVGNLSEAACNAIAANALLARIGAYYHDIGKLTKPQYFIENQDIAASRHDELSPNMSKIVIMNHVHEGVELAKENKLNPLLIEFIRQHHGTSLVYYFYRRALETLEEDREVKEEGFRYPGPKPNTKETAVVLLADSVEAATRTLKDPTPQKIEELVHKVVNNKFIDRQLEECELTLKDLERISAVFVRILSGIYHPRINYPEAKLKSHENNHKKPAKEASHQRPDAKPGEKSTP